MIWSHNEQWMLTGDDKGYVKYWQANMNNVKMFQGHLEAIRGLRYKKIEKIYKSRKSVHRLTTKLKIKQTKNLFFILIFNSSFKSKHNLKFCLSIKQCSQVIFEIKKNDSICMQNCL